MTRLLALIAVLAGTAFLIWKLGEPESYEPFVEPWGDL